VETKNIFSGKAEAEAVAEVVRKHLEPRTIALGLDDQSAVRSVLVVPHGLEVRSLKPLLDEYRLAPERRTGTASLLDLQSFCSHVNRFKDEDSVIFADRNPRAPSLLAVLDYHRAGPTGVPRFGTHRAQYAFPLSDEWSAWKGSDGKVMGQGEFAEFIESRLADVVEGSSALDAAKSFATLFGCTFASPSRLLEISRGLAVHVGTKVSHKVNLASGELQLTFVEEHHDSANAPLNIPRAVLLQLPVFRAGAPYQIPARLRYRQSGTSFSWFYELYRDEVTFDHAFDEACAKAVEATKLPVFAGIPERP
jgi:uncharacterized protein YfdQ (DUF2303 family)